MINAHLFSHTWQAIPPDFLPCIVVTSIDNFVRDYPQKLIP